MGMRDGAYIYCGLGVGWKEEKTDCERGMYWVQVWTRWKIDKPSELMHK